MSKKIIRNLVSLKQIKQTRIRNQLQQLREQQQKIKLQITANQKQVEQLFNQRSQFKQQVYSEQLNNQVVQTQDLNKLRFAFKNFETKIIDHQQQLEQLNQQNVEVEQQIDLVAAELRKFLIKEEKYELITTQLS